LFKRRRKKPFFHKIRDFIWPAGGWSRAGRYMHIRLARIPGTSYAVAAGFACGAAVSFTPFIGLHFILAALLAWLIRGNILTSAMGTIVGNPWSFPFIWVATYQTGLFILRREATEASVTEIVSETIGNIKISQFINDFWGTAALLKPFFDLVFLPMLIGGIILGIVAWFVTYLPLYKVISEFKKKRLLSRLKKSETRLKTLEGHLEEFKDKTNSEDKNSGDKDV
jgi:uncharacterized protein (DUF2062 family)